MAPYRALVAWGGLLAINIGATNCFAGYDGNGNVVMLAGTAGTNNASYGYGPFGEFVRATEPIPKTIPFRFSTKYQDDESDLLYYGCRFYNASTGRWLSRDSIAESGGFNLYAFVANDPNERIDFLGQLTYKTVLSPKAGECGAITPWIIAWLLDTPAKNGGWVIQHIMWHRSVMDCNGNKIWAPQWNYYEMLGFIPANQNVTGQFGDDIWRTKNYGIGTKGTVTIWAAANFYDNGKKTTWPPGFQSAPTIPNWMSGTAPYSFRPPSPAWIAPASTTDLTWRLMTIKWDCCCPHKLDTEFSNSGNLPF